MVGMSEDMQRMVSEMHEALLGTPRQPGFFEIVRDHGRRLDDHDRWLKRSSIEIGSLSQRTEDLEEAPQKAATAELAERKADEKSIRDTAIKKVVDGVVQALIAATIAIGAVMLSAWTGLIKAIQNYPPPHP